VNGSETTKCGVNSQSKFHSGKSEGVSLGKAVGLSTGRRKKGGELVQDAQEEGDKKHL
jgi:hypothetical protein